MTTINPVPMTQTQAPAFRGKNKKALEALDKVCFQMPQEALMQAALKDIRKPVSEDTYMAAHKTAGEAMQRLAGYAYAAKTPSKAEVQETIIRETISGNKSFYKESMTFLLTN